MARDIANNGHDAAAEGRPRSGLIRSDIPQQDRAIESLRGLVERPELPFTGWTIPIEPLFDPMRKLPAFQAILTILADRAR